MFLKDVMHNVSFVITGINHILKIYSNRKAILNGNNISQYYSFNCILDLNICRLGEHKILLLKTFFFKSYRFQTFEQFLTISLMCMQF